MEEFDPDFYRLGGFLDCLCRTYLPLREQLTWAYDYGVNALRFEPKTVITHLAREYDLPLDGLIEFFGAEEEFA